MVLLELVWGAVSAKRERRRTAILRCGRVAVSEWCGLTSQLIIGVCFKFVVYDPRAELADA